ncbi:MAG: primosomal protein N' [Clostridia bacterium]|nr:primosomal protein N' [Clostridia bacterium]
MYCQVIVDIVHENVARPFTYRIPEGLRLERGQRVSVPFGRGTKEGVVTALTEEAGIPEEKIRDISCALEDYAAIPPELMDLAVEIARASHCPEAETLRLMLPPQMRGGRIHARKERRAMLNVTAEEAEREAGESIRKRKNKRAALLRLLAGNPEMSVREISETVRDPREALKQLAADRYIRLTEEEVMRTPEGAFANAGDPAYTLTDGQQEALGEILPAIRKGRGAFLLHGVTGSGKTEVFLAAARKTLEMGKSAIILVPEIALTPQMVSWFRGRFGERSAVIHSRLSAGERYDEWRRIRRGEARIVIGARSAIFSPIRELGLIVIDEEHESSYLSDRHPRYDARAVAEMRCGREGAALVLASATPSMLSFARARRGDYMLLEMPYRVNRRPMPEVELVDMRRELENGNRTVLSRSLREALKACAERGEQAMLLMNRRGYNAFISCRACGYVVKCPQCDLSMTYHVGSGSSVLQCHYCGNRAAVPEKCPECGSPHIRYFGAGTQKVEEEVSRLLPGVPLGRMDLDTTGGKDGHGKVLEAFRSGKTRVLIGTQMIAKGLDFPQVTLVGVIAADLTLNLPDYRSRERTFQLLTQVAGRAGRGALPGKVIIQTYKPDDPVLGYAARQDYRAFFEDEFRRRRTALYPPFTMLARLLAESPREEAAESAAEVLEQKADALLNAHPEWRKRVLLMTRDTPSVSMLRGKHRRQILMKLLDTPETDAFCKALAEAAAETWDNTEVWFEINPTTMI